MSDYRSKYGQSPGWYHHPTQPGLRAYFDGESWTGQVEPITGASVPRGSAPAGAGSPRYLAPPPRTSRALEGWGIALAFFFPIVALIIGIRLLFLRPLNGIGVIVAALVIPVLEVVVVGALVTR